MALFLSTIINKMMLNVGCQSPPHSEIAFKNKPLRV